MNVLGGRDRSAAMRDQDRLTALADGAVMTEVAAGGTAAFGELYGRYCDRAYRVAISICREDSRAQSVVQATFDSVSQSRASYRPQPGSVGAWLLISVRSAAMAVDGKATTASSGSYGVQQVETALARLPEDQQEVITLSLYGELSRSEIAAQLGVPTDTVRARMRLGMEQLRTSLEPAAA
jgi:RNA polymerase sigma-70 factor (ECF subfamily)